MRYLAQIDEAACSAHGDCAAIAPHAFVLEDVAVATGEGAPAEILRAAEACPAAAIAVFDADTGEQVYP